MMKQRMLLILCLLSLTLMFSANATNYYFSSVNGNDANNGTSSATPKNNINLVNSLSLQNGDLIYLERGSKWYQVSISLSGVENVVFDAYGTGDNPVLYGGKVLNSFTNQGSNIWTVTDTDLPSLTSTTTTLIVYVDGQYQECSLYPNNNTFLHSESASSTYIYDSDGSFTTNELVNGIVVSRNANWAWSLLGPITSNTATTINSATEWKGDPPAAAYYAIRNADIGLDQDFEWVFTTDNLKMYYSGANLNSHEIIASTKEFIFNLDDCSGTQIKNIEMCAALHAILYAENGCQDLVVDHCSFKGAGGACISMYASSITYTNNYMEEAGIVGICTNLDSANNVWEAGEQTFEYSTFKRMCWRNANVYNQFRPMDYGACISVNDNTSDWFARYCFLDSISMGIQSRYTADNHQFWVENNLIMNYGLANTTDKAAVYMGGESYSSQVPKYVKNNIIIDGHNADIATPEGGHPTMIGAHAFYTDYSCMGIYADSNTIVNTNIAWFSNSTKNCRFTNNKVNNANTGFVPNSIWNNVIFLDAGTAGSTRLIDAQITGNEIILSSALPYQRFICYRDTGSYNYWSNTFTIDYNKYFMPFDKGNSYIVRNICNYDPYNNDLSTFCSNVGYDCNSTLNVSDWDFSDVSGIDSSQFVLPLWNWSSQTRWVDLHDLTVKDIATGTNYTDSISVPPFYSRFVFYVSGDDIDSILIGNYNYQIPQPNDSTRVLTLSYQGTGSGTVLPGSGTYPIDTVVTLTATANVGSIFAGWSGDTTATSNPLSLPMWKDRYIIATFTDTTTVPESDTIALINFTYDGSYVETGWTNIYGGSSFNQSLGNGINISTSVALNSGVAGEPSTIFPTNVGSTYHFINTDDNTAKTYTVSGLDTSETYTFSFFESRDDGSASGDRTTTYTIGSTSVSINPIGNTDSLLVISDVSTDAYGEIDFVVTKISGQYGYINALIITKSSEEAGDQTVTITAPDSIATESGETTGTFRISRGVETSGNLVVNFTTGGTAILNTDYILSSSGSATITNGNTYVDITVTPDNDAIDESDETVILTLSSGSGYTIGTPSSATVTITDDDTATGSDDTIAKINFTSYGYDEAGWTSISGWQFNQSLDNGVYISTPDILVGCVCGEPSTIFPYNVGRTSLSITEDNPEVILTVSGLSIYNTYSFTFFESRNTAVSGDRTTTFTIDGTSVGMNPIGNTDSVLVISDVSPDASGEIDITVTHVTGYYGYMNAMIITESLGDTTEQTITVIATDSISQESLWPSLKTAIYQISRGTSTTGNLLVNFSMSGTAALNTDYTLSTTDTVTIANGNTYAEVTLTSINDVVYEGNETAILTLTSGNYTIGSPSSDSVTIIDNDSPPTEDTIGMINFTYDSNYDVTGWTNVHGGSSFNVNLGDGVYFSTSETLPAGVNGEPSTIFPTNVGMTYHFIETTDNTAKYYNVSGLDTTHSYRFSFFESRDDNVSGDRTTTYTIGGSSVGLNPIGNTDSLVTISNVEADASGEVDITVTKISGQYGYINAMLIIDEGLKRAKIRSGEVLTGGLDEIQYYPIPVTNMLNLKNVPAGSLISVYDIVGHKVMEQRTGISTDLQLNVSSFKAGIYLFRVIDESSTAIRNFKVVKK